MKRHNRYKKASYFRKPDELSVQSLSVQKCDARIEFRLPGTLKSLINNVSNIKGRSVSELNTVLWLDYLSKAKFISGKIFNPNAIAMQNDVDDFLNRA